MNKQQKLSIGLIVLLFAMMFYLVMIDIQFKERQIESYQAATIACVTNDFKDLCELCYAGIDGKVFR